MTELQLYKFTQNKEIDWRGDKLILWIDFCDLKEFTAMIGYDYLSEGGVEVCLLENCIAIELNDLCESFDIELENIKSKEDYGLERRENY